MAVENCPACDVLVEIPPRARDVTCGGCGHIFSVPEVIDDEDDWDDDEPVTTDDVAEARDLVRGPANGLIWTGWISAILFFFGGLAALVVGIMFVDDPDPTNKEPAILAIVYGLGGAVLGTPYSIAMAIGGHKLKALKSTSWAYTGAILGIITVGICSPLVPLSWAGMGFGIWAVVVLQKPLVKDVLALQGRLPNEDEDS